MLAGAIVRLTVDYDREWDALIDEPALRHHTESAFEFHLIKRPRIESRIRLPANQAVSSLNPLELLDQYWRASHAEDGEAEALQKIAKEIIEEGS
jgi:exonuclease SbcD